MLLHSYEKSKSSDHFAKALPSADQALWDRTQEDSIARLRWAKQNKNNSSVAIKSNALHILSTYHRSGWFINQDQMLADLYLRESAELGHAKSCYDMARQTMEDRDFSAANNYIKIGLQNVNNSNFDCVATCHKQQSMQTELERLEKVCAYLEKQQIDASKSRFTAS
jgi:hypothetical protein